MRSFTLHREVEEHDREQELYHAPHNGKTDLCASKAMEHVTSRVIGGEFKNKIKNPKET